MRLGDFDFCNNHNQFFWYDKDELVATVEIKQEKGVKWICGVYVSPHIEKMVWEKIYYNFRLFLAGKSYQLIKRTLPLCPYTENWVFAFLTKMTKTFLCR